MVAGAGLLAQDNDRALQWQPPGLFKSIEAIGIGMAQVKNEQIDDG